MDDKESRRLARGAADAPQLDNAMDVTGAAQFLGISKQSVYKLCCRRRIPFIKIGARVIFDPGDLSAWRRARRVAPIGGPRE